MPDQRVVWQGRINLSLSITMIFPVLLRPVGDGLLRLPPRVQVTAAVVPMVDAKELHGNEHETLPKRFPDVA